MRILQVINSLATGGAEKLLLDSLPLYNEKGIQMDILLLNGTDYPFKKALNDRQCCNVYSLGNYSVYNPRKIFEIIPYLKKYDLVHVHLFPSQYWVVLAKILSFSKVKLLFTEHSTSNRRMKKPLFKFLDRFIYRRYLKIVCITEEVMKAMVKYLSSPADHFRIITNGVDIDKFIKAIPYSRSYLFGENTGNSTLLIQVSSFQEPKDQKTLIKSLLYLNDSIKLLLVGDGVLRQNHEDMVKYLGLQHRVLFLGIRMDVPELLKMVDIGVLSSSWEGFGIVAVEGMASGIPFIASDVPGLAKVVEGAGILFTPGDAKQLAMAIEKLLANKDYFNSIADDCQKRAGEFDIKIMVDNYIRLYSEII